MLCTKPRSRDSVVSFIISPRCPGKQIARNSGQETLRTRWKSIARTGLVSFRNRRWRMSVFREPTLFDHRLPIVVLTSFSNSLSLSLFFFSFCLSTSPTLPRYSDSSSNSPNRFVRPTRVRRGAGVTFISCYGESLERLFGKNFLPLGYSFERAATQDFARIFEISLRSRDVIESREFSSRTRKLFPRTKDRRGTSSNFTRNLLAWFPFYFLS